jgi:hypothetical protein
MRKVEQMLAALLKFRWPHKRVAEANMRLRPPEAQGSSGYTVEVLEILLEKTLEAHNRVKSLRRILQAATKHPGIASCEKGGV